MLHKIAEFKLNGVEQETPTELLKESNQFDKFLADHPSLRPFRTELSMFYCNGDRRVVACGQADTIFHCATTREMWLVDFKRTDKNLDPDAHDFNKPGLGPMSGVPGNDFNKYSLQQSFYSVMAGQHGVRIDRCFLLQVHPSFEAYMFHECADFRRQAQIILDAV